VLAIACGILIGRGLGDNGRAALITRGLAEMVRLAQAMGGSAATLMGLSGLGDLTLTCTSLKSRNYALGVELGEGGTLEALLAGRRSIAEGVASAAAASELARRLGVDMPIVLAVEAILHQGAGIDATIAALLARPFRTETATDPN
jgi:glycerol-3-phosphate dehydrogenase (NAD(P)+)